MFVLIPNTRPGQWTLDPNGERSTHKNRGRKTTGESPCLVATAAAIVTRAAATRKKRLGTTLRRAEKSKMTTSISSSSVPLATTKTTFSASAAPSSHPQPESRWAFSISTFATGGVASSFGQCYPAIPPTARRSSDVFVDDASVQHQAKKQRPSQLVDTTTQPFPPPPQLDCFQKVYSQSSSSISFSQYSTSQSQSQSQ